MRAGIASMHAGIASMHARLYVCTRQVVELLLTVRAAVDVASFRGGQRALHYAARAGPKRSIDLLLGAGADPTKLCAESSLPLEKV